MATIQLKEVKVYYCKGCGQRHREDELKHDKNGALICPTKRTRVPKTPCTVIVEVIADGV